MTIEIVDVPIENGGSFHRFFSMFTRPGKFGIKLEKPMAKMINHLDDNGGTPMTETHMSCAS
jgi:hypothetical protein